MSAVVCRGWYPAGMRQGRVLAERVAQGGARVQSQRVGDDADAAGGIVPRSHVVCEVYYSTKSTAGWRPRPAPGTADLQGQACTDGQSHPLAEMDVHTDAVVNSSCTPEADLAEYMPMRVAGRNKLDPTDGGRIVDAAQHCMPEGNGAGVQLDGAMHRIYFLDGAAV